jgi:hypothetical protein
MSLIGDVVGEVVGELLGAAFWRGFHATGRRLIFLLSLGWVRIASLRRGGGGSGADFGAFAAGLVFWLAVVAGAIWLMLR